MLLDPLLHYFGPMTYGPEMAVHALYHRITAVAEFLGDGVHADRRALVQSAAARPSTCAGTCWSGSPPAPIPRAPRLHPTVCGSPSPSLPGPCDMKERAACDRQFERIRRELGGVDEDIDEGELAR